MLKKPEKFGNLSRQGRGGQGQITTSIFFKVGTLEKGEGGVNSLGTSSQVLQFFFGSHPLLDPRGVYSYRKFSCPPSKVIETFGFLPQFFI